MIRSLPCLAVIGLACGVSPAAAQMAPSPEAAELANLKAQIEAERKAVKAQRETLDAQEQRLLALEAALLDRLRAAGIPNVAMLQTDPAPLTPPPAEAVTSVGEKPADATAPRDVAVLADTGSVLTRAGRLTIEPSIEYTRADRNRFVFRGIEIPQSVLVGVFDINESRQDILTASATARFGLTNRLEIGARIPWVYREDAAVLVPLVQNPPQSGAGSFDTSSNGSGIGDIELLARYQLTDGTDGWPFLTANLQVTAPTGSSPFEVPRSALGNALESATGFGFWGVQPSLTVLMPSDPATLFGVLGYNLNFGEDVDVRISDAQIDHVSPGSGPSMTAGLGLALNERTSISFAYAHNWLFSTKSTVRPVQIRNGITTLGDPIVTRTRDLQIGRFLFGISYRATRSLTLNWSVELGATDDAPDLRTSLRIPFTTD